MNLKQMAIGALALSAMLAQAYSIVEFGAVGDGKFANDAAFEAAVAKVTADGGGELYFPLGSYRFTKVGASALHFQGVSNLHVRFAPGAEILMDNLQADGMGGGHGVVVTGPCRNITLEFVKVRWATRPAGRSHGDSFRFEGYPSEAETIRNVRFLNCRGENAPQTGAVFMGVSDIFVNNFEIVDTFADGLHFNACRRVNVDGVRGLNVGDDTLAFVTYYSPELSGNKGGAPFGFPALNEWSNADSNAVNITAVGGLADGIRVSGSWNVNIANVVVKNKWGGIQIDSANTSPDGFVGWSYQLSRNINISNVVLEDCSLGMIVRTLNVAPDADRSFWDSDISLQNFSIQNCKEFGLDIQSCAGVNIDNLRTNSPVRILNNRGRWNFTNFTVRDSAVTIHGVQSPDAVSYARNYEPLPVDYTASEQVRTGAIQLAGWYLDNSDLTVVGVGGLRGDRIVIRDGELICRWVKDLKFSNAPDGDVLISEKGL